MNLVCFSNQTGGGIVCDMLNNASNINIDRYHVMSLGHDAFKIGDNSGVYREFNDSFWLLKFSKLARIDSSFYDPGVALSWFGTHCHPSCIPEKYKNWFDVIIAITTISTQSRWYRFLRILYGLHGIDNINSVPYSMIESIAETTFADVFERSPGCVNIEFEAIVNGNFVKEYNLNAEVFEIWKKANHWLYEPAAPILIEIFNKRCLLGE